MKIFAELLFCSKKKKLNFKKKQKHKNKFLTKLVGAKIKI